MMFVGCNRDSNIVPLEHYSDIKMQSMEVVPGDSVVARGCVVSREEGVEYDRAAAKSAAVVVVRYYDMTGGEINNTSLPYSTTLKGRYRYLQEYDVPAFGPSYVYCTICPPELYRSCGLRSFVLGTPCQSLNETYYVIEETLKSFSPKVVVLGADMVVFSDSEYIHASGFAHELIDGFPFGQAKVGMISHLSVDCSVDEFLFPLIKYHSRWKKLGKSDFMLEYNRDDFCGYKILAKNGGTNKISSYSLDKCSRSAIWLENLRWLDRTKELVESCGSRLLLVSAPRTGGLAGGRLASLHDYCAVNHIDFIDLNMEFDATGISNETDFYDKGHLNVLGAEKATRYIGKWLVDHYDFAADNSRDDRMFWDS